MKDEDTEIDGKDKSDEEKQNRKLYQLLKNFLTSTSKQEFKEAEFIRWLTDFFLY